MIAITIVTALTVIGAATIAVQHSTIDRQAAKIRNQRDAIKRLSSRAIQLEADLAEQNGLNAVQAATITTLRDRNAILRDTLEAVPSPVATVLDVVSRVGHKLGGFL